MNAGKLRHVVQIMQPTTAPNASGDPQPPTIFATVRAEVSPMNGSELYRAQQFVSEANVSIRMRYIPGILTSMVAVHGSRTYKILAPLNEEERNRELTLLCKEIGDQ